MAKVKGKKKLNKAITKLVKPFGISKAKLGTEFAYYFTDEHIEFQMTCGDWSDEMFDKFLEKEFGLVNPYPFVLSVLHEVGHHYTEDEFDEIYSSLVDEKDRIGQLIREGGLSEAVKEELEFQYFRLPDEYAATKWAVNYFTQHREECDKMYKKACKALCKFYKKNGVTE